MPFILTDADYSGHPGEPEAARTTPLRFVEFNTVEDVEDLARALRVPMLNRITLGDAGGGNIGCCTIYPDGSSDITLDSYSVLIALHEFSHCGDHRHEVDDHGRFFKGRMAKFITKADRYLKGKISVVVVTEEAEEVPPAAPAPPEPCQQVPYYSIFDEQEVTA